MYVRIWRKRRDYRRISTGILLDNWNTVGNILLRIINRSLETKIFPEDWKESMVTPVEKIRNSIKCEKYRPINTPRTINYVINRRTFVGNDSKVLVIFFFWILTLDGYPSILYFKVTLRWIDEHFHPSWLLFIESTKLISSLSYNSFVSPSFAFL